VLEHAIPPYPAIRAAILHMLRAGPHCVCELAATLGERENNVSNHLSKLRDAGIVRASRHEANARFQDYERDEEVVGRATPAPPTPGSRQPGLILRRGPIRPDRQC
jgi:DNA-binding transcriptional ArsR family regulator